MSRRMTAKSLMAIQKGGRGHGSSHKTIYLATLGKCAAPTAHSKESPKLRESPFPLSTHRYKNGRTACMVLRPSVTMVTPQHNLEEKPQAQEAARNSSTTLGQGHTREVGVTEARDHRWSALGNRREATKRPRIPKNADRGHGDQCFSDPKPRGSRGY